MQQDIDPNSNSGNAVYHIGTSGWTYDHWKGRFYPAELAKSKWFTHYCNSFSTVEINATFYRRFQDSVYNKWKGQVGSSFKYVLKAPRIITHRKFLVDAADDIHSFERSASLLDDKLGLILLQLAPRTKYDPGLLRETILSFNNPKRLAVEFRNKAWFTKEVYTLLKETGAVYCNADSPKTSLNDWITSDIAYIRLHGRNKWYSYNYSEKELNEIALLLKEFTLKGARTFYIFFNNDYEGYAPENALMLKEIIKRDKKGTVPFLL
jgi:uncharacterized protein YecE (DUF72 family)